MSNSNPQESGAPLTVRVGSDEAKIRCEELDAAVERPADTKIELTQQPGAHFRVLMPRRNVTTILVFAGILAGGLGGGGIGIVAAVTAVAASFGYGWLAFGLSSGVLVVAMGIGGWYLVRIARGRNEIDAHGGKLLVINRGVGVKIREYQWTAATDLAFDRLGGALQGPPVYCLFLVTDAGRMPMADFFVACTAAEQRWIRTEWRRFYEPLRDRLGPAKAEPVR